MYKRLTIFAATLCLLVVVSSPSSVARQPDCSSLLSLKRVHLLKLMGLGIPTDSAFFLHHMADIFFRKSGGDLPISRRGVLRYLWNLQLLSYDFADKKILDVAAGKSKFTTLLNQVYRSTGTRAVAFDLAAKRPKSKHDFYVQGDAYQLPFNDQTFDLTVSSWFLNNLFVSDVVYIQGVRRTSLGRAVDEMIRVTKPGGEVRFIQTIFDDWSETNMRAYLESDPRVKEVLSTRPGFFNGSIRVLLK